MTTLIYSNAVEDVYEDNAFENRRYLLQDICFIDYCPDDETYHAVIWLNVPIHDASGEYEEGKVYADNYFAEPAYRKEVTFRATESADADFEIMYPVIGELASATGLDEIVGDIHDDVRTNIAKMKLHHKRKLPVSTFVDANKSRYLGMLKGHLGDYARKYFDTKMLRHANAINDVVSASVLKFLILDKYVEEDKKACPHVKTRSKKVR
jgi:hypothetical protein